MTIKIKIIVKQIIQSVNYTCEINCNHKTFVSQATKHQYLEGHHIIPINLQKYFDYSLDIYANILGVCPSCHRLLHYVLESDKRLVLKLIYNQRKERLYQSGINLSDNEFLDIIEKKHI